MWRPLLVAPLFLGSVLLSACAPTITLTPAITEGEGTRTYTKESSGFKSQSSYTGHWKAGRPQGQGTFILNWNANDNTAPSTTCSGEFGDHLAVKQRPPGPFLSKESMLPGGEWSFGRGTIKSMLGYGPDTVHEGEFVSNLSVGFVCHAYGSGKRTIPAQGSVSGTFNGGLQPGPCVVEERGQGSLAGTCSNDPRGTFKDTSYEVVIAYITNYYTLISGRAIYTDLNGVRYEGTFNRDLAKSGTYRVTRPGQDTMIAIYDNDTLRAEYPSQDTLEKKATRCGSWYFTSGSCPGGLWSGTVVAYSPNDGGMWKLQGRFDKDVPRGEIEIAAMHRDYKIRGTMPPVPTGKALSYSQGEIWNNGVVEYKGAMKGMGPDGTGLCRYEGKLEACEHAEGERVDALYKMREENRKMTQQLQLQQQQLAAARQQQAAPQNNASSNSSFQWGKALALGSGAAIGGISKLSSDAQVKIASGIIQDSMGGQQGMSSTQAATRSVGGGSAVASSGSGSAGGNISSQKQAAASCANEYDGPNGDPQLDSFCKLAAFNACIHRKTGVTDYDAQGRSSCQQLRGLISSTSGNYQCRYCPYPY